MILAIFILVAVIGFLLIERQLVEKSVAKLQMRIHVNGTRGKSSVTEYIASGLSNTSNSVMAKITGVVPTIILPDSRQVISRKGAPRVQEQFYVIRYAARRNIEKLVLECMSIAPEFQQIESRLFKPHIYVITNIKDDHREAMGPTLHKQAEAICSAIPSNSIVVTNETLLLDIVRKRAEERNSKVVLPEKLDPDLEKQLPVGVFPENVALAVEVCKLCGVNSIRSINSILSSFTDHRPAYNPIEIEGKEYVFLNAFSVNDVDSTESFIRYWKSKLNIDQSYSLILNTRSDRPLRTDQICSWIMRETDQIDHIIISGSHYRRAVRNLIKSGFVMEKISVLKRGELNQLKKRLHSLITDGSLIVGLGNSGEKGDLILKELV